MSNDANQPALILTSVADPASGEKIADALVGRGLAACVKVGAACTSTYTWQGKRVCEKELPVMVTTTVGRTRQALDALLEVHPYEVPEAIVLASNGTTAAYLDWLAKSTGGD